MTRCKKCGIEVSGPFMSGRNGMEWDGMTGPRRVPPPSPPHVVPPPSPLLDRPLPPPRSRTPPSPPRAPFATTTLPRSSPFAPVLSSIALCHHHAPALLTLRPPWSHRGRATAAPPSFRPPLSHHLALHAAVSSNHPRFTTATQPCAAPQSFRPPLPHRHYAAPPSFRPPLSYHHRAASPGRTVAPTFVFSPSPFRIERSSHPPRTARARGGCRRARARRRSVARAERAHGLWSVVVRAAAIVRDAVPRRQAAAATRRRRRRRRRDDLEEAEAEVIQRRWSLWPSWWSLVRFRRAINFFGGESGVLEGVAPCGSGLWCIREFEIGFDGCPLPGPGGAPQRQKPLSWRGKPPVLRVKFGHSGAFFCWACGQIRAAPGDIN